MKKKEYEKKEKGIPMGSCLLFSSALDLERERHNMFTQPFYLFIVSTVFVQITRVSNK